MNTPNPLALFAGALEHLPEGCRLHARSWAPRYAAALAQEVVIQPAPSRHTRQGPDALAARWPDLGP
jgi:hypothetical protein